MDENEILAISTEGNILYYKMDELPLKYDKLIVGSNNEIIDCKFIENGNSIAVASNTDHIRIFNLSNFSCRILPGHKDIIVSIDVSSDSNYIVTASKDNTIRLWDTLSLTYSFYSFSSSFPLSHLFLSSSPFPISLSSSLLNSYFVFPPLSLHKG